MHCPVNCLHYWTACPLTHHNSCLCPLQLWCAAFHCACCQIRAAYCACMILLSLHVAFALLCCELCTHSKMVTVSVGVCSGRGLMYRYQLQSYAKLIGVLKVIVYALLLNGISSSTSIAQVGPCQIPTNAPISSLLTVLCWNCTVSSPCNVPSTAWVFVAEHVGLMILYSMVSSK